MLSSDFIDTNVGQLLVGWLPHADTDNGRVSITMYSLSDNDGSEVGLCARYWFVKLTSSSSFFALRSGVVRCAATTTPGSQIVFEYFISQKCKTLVDSCVNVGSMASADIAEQIANDKIDVLINLNGARCVAGALRQNRSRLGARRLYKV